MPCGTWTPEFPKPIPAKVAAYITASRAASSPASVTARTRYAPSNRSASTQAKSLYGFAPCASGRASGVAGRSRWRYGFAVNDSRACARTSNPLQATTAEGNVRVASGSTTPSVGRSRRDEIPVLMSCASKSKIAIPVHSLPVPEVVGQAMCGASGPGTGAASPYGALT